MRRSRRFIAFLCRSGRHRTVANAEAQRDPIQDKLYGPCGPWDDRSRPKVKVFHLQAETDWNSLCESDCPSCNLTSKPNRLNLARAYDRLKGIIPSRTTEVASVPAKEKVKSLVDQHDDYTSMLVIQSICTCHRETSVAPVTSGYKLQALRVCGCYVTSILCVHLKAFRVERWRRRTL